MSFKASFSQKIIGTIAVLIIFFIATIGAISYQVLQVQRQSTQTVSGDVPQLIRMANLRYNILQLRRAEKDISIDMSMRPDSVTKRTDQWSALSVLCLKIADDAIAHASGDALVNLEKAKLHLLAYVDLSKKSVAEAASKTLLEMAIFETEIEKPKAEIRKAEEIVTGQITAMRETTDLGSSELTSDINFVWWAVSLGLGITLATAFAAGYALLRSLRLPVAELGNGISKVKAGNLVHVLRVGTQDELGEMSTAFNDMVADLRNTVSNVRQAGESVAIASAEIAQGNNDLSMRTEQQASALEQTSAAMEELNGTVRQTAESAKEANRLATSASQFASKGGEAVARVISTMKDIEDSSSKIASIIQVIDGIAFQTNILALNAAVEAARAGEQGRGFAVVASEVRSLAGRSADAAREIKNLITASVERVAQGNALVGQAGVTIDDAVQAIKRVSQIMATIDVATSEQANGVHQVGQAVSQMDQATQQNAALVEEIAAAASSLKAQAKELVDTVATFNIGQPNAAFNPSVSNLRSGKMLILGV